MKGYMEKEITDEDTKDLHVLLSAPINDGDGKTKLNESDLH